MRVRPVRPVFTGAGGAVDFDSLRGVFFMSDLREAVKALIAASESCDIDRGTGSWAPDDAWSTLVDALEDVLAQPIISPEIKGDKAEPVLHKWAALFEDPNNDWQAGYESARRWVLEVGLQSIAAPPQRKPLTDEEIEYLAPASFTWREFARAIEHEHGIGND